MSSRRFAMSVAYSIAGLVSALLILAACQPVPPRSPMPTPVPSPVSTATPVAPAITPVPIATWIAQGIPADTRIYYRIENSFTGFLSEISILADGSATHYYLYIREDPEPRFYAGRLSAEELKRVVLAFDGLNFFALAVDSSGCLYDMTQPPVPPGTVVFMITTDAAQVSASMTINGLSKSLVYYAGCLRDHGAQVKLDAIGDVLRNAVEDLPPATPTPAPVTSEAGETRTWSEDSLVTVPVAAAGLLREISPSLGFAAQGDT